MSNPETKMRNFIEKNPITFQVGTFVGLLITVITSVISITKVYFSMDSRMGVCETERRALTIAVDNNIKKIETLQHSTYTIETDLARIKATLLEIKKDIK